MRMRDHSQAIGGSNLQMCEWCPPASAVLPDDCSQTRDTGKTSKRIAIFCIKQMREVQPTHNCRHMKRHFYRTLGLIMYKCSSDMSPLSMLFHLAVFEGAHIPIISFVLVTGQLSRQFLLLFFPTRELWMCSITSPPAMATLTREPNSSSPWISSCKWHGGTHLLWDPWVHCLPLQHLHSEALQHCNLYRPQWHPPFCGLWFESSNVCGCGPWETVAWPSVCKILP